MTRRIEQCATCGGDIEYVDVKDPYWRHVGATTHPARRKTRSR
ncbi:hypothetical protein ACIA5A_06125 [Micromonospora sp. NPDC051300]